MKVALGTDHRGFRLKNFLIDYLSAKGVETVDAGTFSKEPCDYPDIIYPAVKMVQTGTVDRAIVMCYTGIGSAIVANKVRGIRAALVFNSKMAGLTRQHNDSNVLVLPSGFLKREYVKKIVWKWLTTPFEGGRHLRRVRKITQIEEKENV